MTRCAAAAQPCPGSERHRGCPGLLARLLGWAEGPRTNCNQEGIVMPALTAAGLGLMDVCIFGTPGRRKKAVRPLTCRGIPIEAA